MAILTVKDKNGNKINIPAINGKSAYQYALDGGYTGSESEFIDKLSKEWATKDEVRQLEEQIAGYKASEIVLDLEKYGIITTETGADLTATTENYEICHANAVGINKAIADAKALGIKKLIFPKGNYPLCYETDLVANAYPIIVANDIDLEGYGARLYIVYDVLDTGLNPYYKDENEPMSYHAMCGIIIDTDSDVCGFDLHGEREIRSEHETAKYREKSYGVRFLPNAVGAVVKDCYIHHFSGDGIGGNFTTHGATWTSATGNIWTAQTIQTDGTIVESKTSWLCPAHSWLPNNNKCVLKAGGYKYFIWSLKPIKIHCYDSDNNYLGFIYNNQGEPFEFLKDTALWYLEVVYSSEHETTETATINYAIDYSSAKDCIIDNCEIAFNQRGGISNMPSGTIIKNSIIHHNGGAYGNMPAFYDGTQFGIDQEDWYSHSLTIENCIIFENLHGVLYRCHKMNIVDSVIYGVTRSLNYQVDFYAKGTHFHDSCEMVTPASFGSKVAINCVFNSNVSDAITRVDTIESGSKVSVQQTITEGKEIGRVTVDGVSTPLYAPSSTGDSANEEWEKFIDYTVTDEDVTNAKQYYNFSLKNQYDEVVNCKKIAVYIHSLLNNKSALYFKVYDGENKQNSDYIASISDFLTNDGVCSIFMDKESIEPDLTSYSNVKNSIGVIYKTQVCSNAQNNYVAPKNFFRRSNFGKLSGVEIGVNSADNVLLAGSTIRVYGVK